MPYCVLRPWLTVACLVALVGCAPPLSGQGPARPETSMRSLAKTFHTIDLAQCRPAARVGLDKKVDHFLMVFDPSASMTEAYAASEQCLACHQNFAAPGYAADHAASHGSRPAAAAEAGRGKEGCAECHRDFLYTKLAFAKEIARCFNASIPDLAVTTSLRTFGSPVYTAASLGPAPYARAPFDLALQKIVDADGASPLGQTLLNAGKDWFAAEGPMAVLVISDGKDMGDDEVLAAKELAGRYGDRLCLYTVQIGDDQNGREVLAKMAAASGCGESVNGDALLEPQAMTDLARRIFLKPTPMAADHDNDGVADAFARCPDSQAGEKVDANGCWQLEVQAEILFDFDRYTLKTEGQTILDRVEGFLARQPGRTLTINGHTDNVGTEDYNLTLSRRRAEAGRDYLIRHGVAAARIAIAGHGFRQPRASNETSEGRAVNRRIEFSFAKHD